jgi:inosose dehydratase
MSGYRVAGAPITWGVSEVPGWGFSMPPSRVLAEMSAIGLTATELGPPGYLPADPGHLRDLLAAQRLRLVAGFLAVVLHEPGRRGDSLAEVRRLAATLSAAGADILVLAAALPTEGYDRHPTMTNAAWNALSESLRLCEEIAAEHGLGLAFHPHAGTAVEKSEEVSKLLETTDVQLCLDTGHLYLGGVNPAQLARDAGARVRHVHLKDIDAGLAERVRAGGITYGAAVRAGLYRPLGQGDLDLRAVLEELGGLGYEGWYVLEQDTALDADPAPDDGPIRSARQSLEFFRGLHGAEHKRQEETA